ncbi:YedE family putative selenium transporter [Campylobacter cuniculorum]|uniref:YedE-related selenium metabolism membrane protein n=2 Tax=Campylobacter cuniculorum TaxID=374106 RepID=A0ABX6TWR2_9BACT|nr:YedE family putative selenium transporter [Campylobacter cuniculorum]ARJ56709.1 putative selenium metabolism protein, YedE family [Campylobacter cuniculorum DSM 23162 = LMG 24588]QOR04180.1 YedE-related selenium metabolism membrane protein [Campylobacter cuniculorum]
MKIAILPVLAGAVFGIIAPLLVYFGNPGNMGLCAGCFTRDIAGALNLHNAAALQYMRPEILALVLGSFLSAFLSKSYNPRAGSAPIARFFLGIFTMIGILVFLGCPWRAFLRISAGDLSALAGILGLVAGVCLGIFFLKKGFSLGRAKPTSKFIGFIFPAFIILCLVLLFISLNEEKPLLKFSTSGVGFMHAPVLISLIAGLIIGVLFQKSKFCSISGISAFLLFRDTYLLQGVIALIICAFLSNLALGYFHLGFTEQPIAHNDFIWNFLGMFLAGSALSLAGGCPGRQLVLSGEGDGDAAVFVMGSLFGAALAHNFSLASSPAGISANAPFAVILGLIFVLCLGLFSKNKETI